MKTLSIVMPIYNEQATLAQCVRRVLAAPADTLDGIPLAKQLILIDDASNDGTAEVVQSLPDEFPDADLTIFRHERNLGKGAALRTGFAAVTGDIVIIQDADLEYDPNEYPRLLKPILDGRADVVYGSRFATGSEKRVLYFWHAVGNKIVTTLSNMCTNLNLSDMETCYKVFRREILDAVTIKSQRFGVEPELTAKIAKNKFRIYEVGISYSGRTYEEGKKITWKDGLKALAAIIRFRLFN